MKKFLSTFTGAGVLVIAASSLLVGLVWATSSASDDVPDTSAPADSVVDSTVPGDSVPGDSVPDTTLPPELTTAELTALVQGLTARVTALEETVTEQTIALEAATAVVQNLTGRVEEAETTVATFAGKTSQLSDDGTYRGDITPSQISPRLTADDVRGDWPLDRTRGSLGIDRIGVDGWGCNADSRYHVALVVGPFRGVECARLPK